MPLPTEKTKLSPKLLDYTILIHGIPKIGKSTLANEAGKVLFFDTEGGLKGLEVYAEPVYSWTNGDETHAFLNMCVEFVKGNHEFNALCIDTIDVLHKLCTGYLMKKSGIIHPSELEWGKGWDMIKDEFMRPLNKLAVSPYGLILISHSRSVEVTTRISKITKAVPTLQNYIWTQISAFVDIILYYNSEVTPEGQEKRYLRTKPSENWIAGDRTGKLLQADPIEIGPNGTNWPKLDKIFTGDDIKIKKNQPLLT